MDASWSSALITEQGRKVLLRVHGRLYEVSQDQLRSLLGLRPGPPGLGITIDGNRFHFEFVGDDKTVELSIVQLHRLLSRHLRKST
jgi:hypothetical protein